MKKVLYYIAISGFIMCSAMMTGCDDDKDDILENTNPEEVEDIKDPEDIIEGPSSNDDLIIPTEASILGDSIRQIKTFSLAEHRIAKVKVHTTQNGHISVLGGYKDKSAVYVYAKTDDDNRANLNDEQINRILEKYYTVESYANESEIVVNVTEKSDVEHESDFQALRISVNIFTPQNVSTDLSISRGSIIAKNVHGDQHVAKSVSGAIKYMHSSGNNITVNSETGFVGLINTEAFQTVNAALAKGNIQLVLNKTTKADLNLISSIRVNAHILNIANFQGVNTAKKVEGKLNGGGYKINANSGLGVINLRWYEEGNHY